MQAHHAAMPYHGGAILLHWSMAILVFALLGMGLYMTSLPDGDPKWWWYGQHKSLGLLLFVLLFVRIAWRVIHPAPPLPASMPPTDRRIAHGVHVTLYGLMLLLPVSGYVDSSAGGYHLAFFDLFDIPKVIGKDKALEEFVVELHRLLAYAMLGLLSLHVGAAAWHARVRRDGLFARMLPGRRLK